MTPKIYEECVICSESHYHEDYFEKSLFVTSCGHHFHYGCLSRWVKINNSCPTCRTKNVLINNQHDNDFGQADNDFGQADNDFGQADNDFGQADNDFGQSYELLNARLIQRLHHEQQERVDVNDYININSNINSNINNIISNINNIISNNQSPNIINNIIFNNQSPNIINNLSI